MTTKRAELSAEKLREILSYDQHTGAFTWRVSPHPRFNVGDPAGYKSSHGYINIEIDGVEFRAHRLAWLYMTGEWPPSLVDHDDRTRNNNRWKNLRLATRVQNAQNTGKAMPGVRWYPEKERWRVRLWVGGKLYSGGSHRCLLDAAAARLSLERKHCTHSPRVGA